MQEIGTVISTEESPTSSEFWFVVNNNIPIRKFEFVQLPFDDGILICRVEEIQKVNRYYSRPDSVAEYEKSGKPLSEQFPVDRWEYVIARATALGIYSNGFQKRVTFPVSPGQKVYKADNNILSDFLGFDKNGIYLGKMEFHNIDVKLNISKLFQKHLAILALSGAGKSYTTSVLIEELLNRSENLGKPAIIVFDPHGEYIGFAEDQNYIINTKVIDGNKVSIATKNLSPQLFSEIIPEISGVQKRELGNIIKKIREEKKVYTLFDIIEEIEKNVKNLKTKDSLISWINELNYTGLFKAEDYPEIENIVKPGQLIIFDLSEITNLREKQIIVTYFMRKIFNLRKNKIIPPSIIIIEEAHQFCPNSEEEKAISRSVIETIAREGRKFNACLVLISQRPKRLSTTALSQCNTNIILRITNPVDLQHIQESTEGITNDLINMIPGLKVGEAIITGEAVNYPILLRVRERRSKLVEKGMKLEDEILKFNNSLKFKEDMEAFVSFK
jgi:DNA helicase HerA-like ATPase